MSSLYIHIPFCERKCLYCSFVVSVGQKERRDEYIESLLREARLYPQEKIKTLYLGGGTPSLLEASQMEKLFTSLRAHFSLDDLGECTLEANPEDLSSDKLKFLHALGINRVSLGAQTFNEKYLKYLGRNHNRESILRALDTLYESPIKNISLDLMFSFPDQTHQELKEDLDHLKTLPLKHVSLYSLTIDPNSRFYARQVNLKESDKQAEDYTCVVDSLVALGFKQYEVSNFAKPGFESTHNINYWQGGNYIGLGIGAHSHRDGHRYWNISNLFDYLDKSRAKQCVIAEEEHLDLKTRMMEEFLFGLRMNEGVDIKALQKKFGLELSCETYEKTDRYIREGWLKEECGRLKATRAGQLILDELCSRLL